MQIACKNMFCGSYIYGPVVSRRLGVALGVNLFNVTKICSFDCIYCEVGRTRFSTDKLSIFVNSESVITEIKNFLACNHDIQYISFAGCGEPTLHKELGYIIRQIKSITRVPVAVFTNSSLIDKKEVQLALANADIVLPSLDSARQETFEKINRPFQNMDVTKIIQGLIGFRKQYTGQIWLELLFVSGINDSVADIEALISASKLIHPDKVQLNTVYRCGAEKWARPLDKKQLNSLASLFTPRADVV